MVDADGPPRRPGHVVPYVAVVAAVTLVAALLWGLSRGGIGSTDDGSQGPPSSHDSGGGSATSRPPDPDPSATAPVPVPVQGSYLGVFVNRFGINGGGSLKLVLGNLPDFTERMGRNPAIVASYQSWDGPWVLDENLRTVADTYGAIPMVSWGCGSSNEQIASGAEDPLITRFAEQLRDYGGPILLRWYWEANLLILPECLGPGTPAEQAAHYVDAFRHIADVFDAVGASNVAFVWAPSVAPAAAPLEPFYPGDEYVDWIGADGYGLVEFSAVFGGWYDAYAGRGKPMIVAETGAIDDQAQFLADVGEVLPAEFPQIKAIVYFDAIGKYIDWRLSSYGGSGLDAFATLGREPWFAVVPTS